MAKKYFQMVPAIDYDLDGDGTTKVVIDILRRVKVRANLMLDGAVFYNYQMQDGDNAEIIADKYYGSSQYHWIVLLMNNIIDHTYDFVLNDWNFEKFIEVEYGSQIRADGVSINLASSSYLSATIGPNWYADEQYVGSGTVGANSGLVSGTWPAGNSTAITIHDEISEDPFANIDVGDVVNIFIPERWYEYGDTSIHSGTISADSTTNTVIYLDSSASVIEDIYAGATLTVTGVGSGDTEVTGNTRTINIYTASTQSATLVQNALPLFTDEFTYDLEYSTPGNLSKVGYTAAAKVLSKSVSRTGEEDDDGDWIPHSQNETRLFQLNTNLNSNTFGVFTWDASELVHIQTGIHHFEMDVYDAAGTLNLANNVHISQQQYANNTFNVGNKIIVSNLTYEEEANEEKRVIFLLKKEYLSEFVDEFENLMKVGA